MDSKTDTRRSLMILLAGVVGVVALLTWIAGWALPLVIFAIIFIVMAHEFGHFITAKRAGMKVTDFFVGFGPVIWSTTIGETRYGVRAILAGGYVKVPGMTWTEEIPEEEESRTYRAASYPRKVLFASAGSLMHIVMALLYLGDARHRRTSVLDARGRGHLREVAGSHAERGAAGGTEGR